MGCAPLARTPSRWEAGGRGGGGHLSILGLSLGSTASSTLRNSNSSPLPSPAAFAPASGFDPCAPSSLLTLHTPLRPFPVALRAHASTEAEGRGGEGARALPQARSRACLRPPTPPAQHQTTAHTRAADRPSRRGRSEGGGALTVGVALSGAHVGAGAVLDALRSALRHAGGDTVLDRQQQLLLLPQLLVQPVRSFFHRVAFLRETRIVSMSAAERNAAGAAPFLKESSPGGTCHRSPRDTCLPGRCCSLDS
eukprot:3804887-Rhodomonas_salina.1